MCGELAPNGTVPHSRGPPTPKPPVRIAARIVYLPEWKRYHRHSRVLVCAQESRLFLLTAQYSPKNLQNTNVLGRT